MTPPSLDEEGRNAISGLQNTALIRQRLLGIKLVRLFQNATTRWLWLKIAKAGGTREMRTNLIANLFGLGAPRYSGGVAVEYFVLKSDGQIDQSGVVVHQSKYKKADYA